MSFGAYLKRKIFTLPYSEASFDKRRLTADPELRPHLEGVTERFLDGYNLAIDHEADLEALAVAIEAQIDVAYQGFAFEGAAMFLALMDILKPGKGQRAERFMTGVGASHDYIICIGIGFAVARIPWVRSNVEQFVKRYPPGLAALVVDGYGFHEGFFHHEEHFDRCRIPRGISGELVRLFDNGLGRVSWFVRGADPERIRDTIERFPAERHAELWAGLGLACSYAGSAFLDLEKYESVLERIVEYAGPHRDHLGIGVAFAAETRNKGNNPTVWSARAAEVVLGMSFAEAAQLAGGTWEGVKRDLSDRPPEEVAFEMHRQVSQRILEQLAAKKGRARAGREAR